MIDWINRFNQEFIFYQKYCNILYALSITESFIIHTISINQNEAMGNEPPPKNVPKKSMEDHIIDMKINAKQIQRAAKNAEK